MIHTKRKFFELGLPVIFLITFATVLAGCSGIPANAEIQPVQTASTNIPTEALSTDTLTPEAPSQTPTATIYLTPTSTFTPTPDTRPIPYYWRDWPVNLELSPKAKQILLEAAKNPNLDVHSFIKVGDCQMVAEIFLGVFPNGDYSYKSEYKDTVTWFAQSMVTDNVTAYKGLGISSVLDPMFGLAAGHTQCEQNETPLDCELRIHHPVVVLIAMGTNWIPNAEGSFENYLRTVVDRILETGALPILANKADNIEGNWKLDQAIAQVAYDYDLPMVNVWRNVQNLPNHGLEEPKNIYLTPDGWMRNNYAWLDQLYKVWQVLSGEGN